MVTKPIITLVLVD